MTFTVVLDACVLLPYQLCDVLLNLADAHLYTPIWSDDILDEVQRHLTSTFNLTSAKATRRIDHMRRAYPHAAVKGYRDLVPMMTNHPKDRHVLAAAVRAGAGAIVTANLKDFPATALDTFDIEAIHPDQFLLDQLDLDRIATLGCLQRLRAAYKNPAMSWADFFQSLRGTVPGFANHAESLMREQEAAQTPLVGMPLPLEIVSDEEAEHALFPDGPPDMTTPLGTAYLWWMALEDPAGNFPALQFLSFRPDVWGDYVQAKAARVGWAFSQLIERHSEHPGRVAYARLVPSAGSSVRAFGDVPIGNGLIISMRADPPDPFWRVWSMSWDFHPSAADILGESR